MQPRSFKQQFLLSLENDELRKFDLEEYEIENGVIYTTMLQLDDDDIPYMAQFVFYKEDELADVMVMKPIKYWDTLETYRIVNHFNGENRFIRMLTQENLVCVRGNVWKEEGVDALWDMFFLAARAAGGYFGGFETAEECE